MKIVTIFKSDPQSRRRTGDQIRVTDGPFTESKEIVGDGTCDLHEVGGTPKFGP